ncbi:MAG: response regulator [Gammaproteobacteria bacterium]|nr:response regulator [Gammaproteobacteria bacterium]
MASTIWIVDDDDSIRWVIEKALVKQGYLIRDFELPDDLLSALSTDSPNLIISDVRMPQMNGFELLSKINERPMPIPVIVMTAFGDLDSAVDSFRYGAFEYLTKPFDIKDLLAIVRKSLLEIGTLHESMNVKLMGDTPLLGDSFPTQHLFANIDRLSFSETNVLIHGESGTGKTLVAKAIHASSPRADQPMMSLAPRKVPADRLESELFGHEAGAFPDAIERRIGLLEKANGGTVFLNHIDELPKPIQTKLVSALSAGCFCRMGGEDELHVDFRLVASSNRDLEQLSVSQNFDPSLFLRLIENALWVPPLRDRVDDIPTLVSHFLRKVAGESNLLGASEKNCHQGVLQVFEQYRWPENVRQLENLIYSLNLLVPGSQINVMDLPLTFMEQNYSSFELCWQTLLLSEAKSAIKAGRRDLVQRFGYDFEHTLIDAAMDHTNGHRINASEILGWGRNTLSRKLKEKNEH